MPTVSLDNQENNEGILQYLDREPPYDGLGRVILAASKIEVSLKELAGRRGLGEPSTIRRASTQDILKRLRNAAVVSSHLGDECDELLARRDLIAHGEWFNLFSRGSAILKQDRTDGDYKGRLVTQEELVTWAEAMAAATEQLKQL